MSELGSWTLDAVHNVDALTLLNGLPDDCIDLVVTSPPYDNLRTYNGYSFDFEPIAQESYRVLKQGGVLVWVVGDAFVKGSETLTCLRQALYFVQGAGFNMHQRMVWRKNAIPHIRPNAYLPDFEDMYVLSKGTPKTFNGITKRNRNAGQTHRKIVGTANGYKTYEESYTIREESLLGNVWEIRPGANGSDVTGHPAPFPEALAERHILTWSNAGDVVLDYFGGSGTTAKMARNNGRRWLACDISAEYCDLMRRRLALPYTLPLFASAPR